MRAAIFIDGGYLLKQLQDAKLTPDYSRLAEYLLAPLRRNAQLDLMRCYFYYCPPWMSEKPTETELRRMAAHEKFVAEIQGSDRWQIRLGKLERRRDGDKEVFAQKRVDVQLSVDLVNHAAAGHIQHAVLIAGDSDFIPAVVAAKESGATLTLWCDRDRSVHKDLLVHADEVYYIDWREFPTRKGPRSETHEREAGEAGREANDRPRRSRGRRGRGRGRVSETERPAEAATDGREHGEAPAPGHPQGEAAERPSPNHDADSRQPIVHGPHLRQHPAVAEGVLARNVAPVPAPTFPAPETSPEEPQPEAADIAPPAADVRPQKKRSRRRSKGKPADAAAEPAADVATPQVSQLASEPTPRTRVTSRTSDPRPASAARSRNQQPHPTPPDAPAPRPQDHDEDPDDDIGNRRDPNDPAAAKPSRRRRGGRGRRRKAGAGGSPTE